MDDSVISLAMLFATSSKKHLSMQMSLPAIWA